MRGGRAAEDPVAVPGRAGLGPRRGKESWRTLLAELEKLLAPRVFTYMYASCGHVGGWNEDDQGPHTAARIQGFDSQGLT